MKVIGIIFIVASTGYMGFYISYHYKQKSTLLHQFSQCLQLIRNEIAFCGTPLPKIFSLLSSHADAELSFLFQSVADLMQQDKSRRLSDALQEVEALGLCPVLTPVLTELGNKLGEYDLEAQLAGISQVQEHVNRLMGDLEQERRTKGKAYESLGICAGLALVILLV